MIHKPVPPNTETPTIIFTAVSWSAYQRELYDIRYRVFVVEQQIPEELEQDEQDPVSQHILARTAGGLAVGTGRLLPDGHIGRVAVLADWRRYGIGRQLMEHLIELARQQGHKTVHLNAQISAQAFYTRLGFHSEGEPFQEAGIPHQSMYRTL